MTADNMPIIDPSVPTVARTYAYLLGDNENCYESDRRLALMLGDIVPGIRGLAINNRKFLERSAAFVAADCDVHQFIDFGSGLPTANNVHQIVQRIHSDARVVYVDNDPITAVHGRRILGSDKATAFILADMQDAEAIFNNPDTTRLIDFEQQVCLLFNSVAHCLKDSDDPWGMVKRAMDRVPSGSYLVFAHLTSDDQEIRDKLTQSMLEATHGNWGRVRTSEEVRRFFHPDWEMIPPGLVELTTWRPSGDLVEQTYDIFEFGGVARKP